MRICTHIIVALRFPEIPGRWRRHCAHGPMMSGPGCNLVGDGTTEAGNAAAAGKCVCGPSVPWCPGEPRPYMYTTRHECKLNLEAKIAYGRTHSSHARATRRGAARRVASRSREAGCSCGGRDNARQSALMAKLISRSIRQMARVTFVYRCCESPLARVRRAFVPVHSVLLETRRSRDAANPSDPSERPRERPLGD